MDNTVIENAGFSPARLTRIDALMQRYVDEGKLAGVIATVARRGQTVYLEKFGMMDIEAHKPMQFDAIFRIASMTKPVTSVAVMTLYEEGHFHLNTPISEFIPGFKDTKVFVRETDDGIELADLKRPITFRHLFTHTAGLSYGWNENDPVDRQYQKAQQEAGGDPREMTVKDLVQALTTLPLAFQPGSAWLYGYGLDIAGLVVERVSGQRLGDFLRERVFAPLGMAATGFHVPVERAGHLAGIYAPGEGGLRRIEDGSERLPLAVPFADAGSSGLLSTLEDYGRFADMLAAGGERAGIRVMAPATARLLMAPHAPQAPLLEALEAFGRYAPGSVVQALGGVVRTDARSGPGSAGEYAWGGAAGTGFFAAPRIGLSMTLMTQVMPVAAGSARDVLRPMVYAALQARD